MYSVFYTYAQLFFSSLLLIFNFFPLIFIQRKNKIHIVLPFDLAQLKKEWVLLLSCDFFLLCCAHVQSAIYDGSQFVTWKYTTTFLYYIQIPFTQKNGVNSLLFGRNSQQNNYYNVCMFLKKNSNVHTYA